MMLEAGDDVGVIKARVGIGIAVTTANGVTPGVEVAVELPQALHKDSLSCGRDTIQRLLQSQGLQLRQR
jgi:hypothetical protein